MRDIDLRGAEAIGRSRPDIRGVWAREHGLELCSRVVRLASSEDERFRPNCRYL